MRKLSRYTDHDLANLIAAGNIEAFRELFDKYRNKIFSIAWKFTGKEETSQDIIQEVFIKLWLNKERLPMVENLNAYLNTIVKNHIFNYLRKVAHEQALLQKLSIRRSEKDNEHFDNICYKELQELVHKAVGQLPPQQRRVYNFSRIEGLKHEEIAERMGISRSTVKSHMVEALRSIKKFLSVNGEMVGVLVILLLI